MLNGEGNEKDKKKNKNKNNNNNKTKQNKTIGLRQKKIFSACSTRFWYIFVAVVFHFYNVKLPILVTRFIEEMSHE